MLKRNKPLLRKTPLARGNSQLKRTPLRRVSTTRAAELRLYSLRRKRFLAENPVCEVFLILGGWKKIGPAKWTTILGEPADLNALLAGGCPASTQVHHKNKRRRAMLLNEDFWMAVSRENHERIENNKSWAREKGFLLNF